MACFQLLLAIPVLLVQVVSGQAEGSPLPLTQDNVQEIVEGHNLFRQMVIPRASNMREVVSVIANK